MTLRTFSYGGGVQSTAALVLAAQGKIDFPIFLFSNVGDDSEHPDTLRYVDEVAKSYAAANTIELHELRHTRRDGEPETLYRQQASRSILRVQERRPGAPAPASSRSAVSLCGSGDTGQPKPILLSQAWASALTNFIERARIAGSKRRCWNIR